GALPSGPTAASSPWPPLVPLVPPDVPPLENPASSGANVTLGKLHAAMSAADVSAERAKLRSSFERRIGLPAGLRLVVVGEDEGARGDDAVGLAREEVAGDPAGGVGVFVSLARGASTDPDSAAPAPHLVPLVDVAIAVPVAVGSRRRVVAGVGVPER